MNPYEPPQSELQPITSGSYVMELTPLRQQLLSGIGCCMLGGKELCRGVLSIILFFAATVWIRQTNAFDVRFLYVLGLYPLYAIAIGWLMNRQGFLILSIVMETNEARYCALKSRQLSLAKLLIFAFALLIVAFLAIKLPGSIIVGLWAILELQTIRMQTTVIRHLTNDDIESAHSLPLEQYRLVGFTSMLCFLLAASQSILPITNFNGRHLPWQLTLQDGCLLIAWVMYLLQLRAYWQCYVVLNQMVASRGS